MKKLKGPELKMPELKVPGFVADLYYDLRDRRLLPLLALVLVAIVAAPFLLGKKSEPVTAPSAAALATEGESLGPKSHLRVVEATPGLRDYRKRLRGRTPTDPFVQRFTGLPPSAQAEATQCGCNSPSEEGAGSVTVTEESATEVTQTGNSGGSPSGKGGASSGEGGGETAAQNYEFVIDVQIAHSEKTAGGGEEMSEWEARHDVPILGRLPGKETSVVMLLGANLQKERLVFLVSHGVKSISGEYACISRGEICELLEVAKGILLEFVYETTGVTYAIKVTKATVIPKREQSSARSNRAAYILASVGGPLQNFSK